MSENRVFVFGSGRSGTTLLAKLLDSSPRVLYRHEPDKLQTTNEIPFLPEPEQYPAFVPAATSYLEQLYHERLPCVVGKKPRFPKDYRSLWRASLHGALVSLLRVAEKGRLKVPVPDLTHGEEFLTVVKSVNSICRVPLFGKANPDIKFIHIVRHPGAVIASALKGVSRGVMGQEDFVDPVSRLSNARRLPVSPEGMKNASLEERMAYVWMVHNDKTFGEMHGNPNYFLVSYEDLCVNMSERLSEIFQFLGSGLDDQSQAFVNALGVAGDSSGYFSVIRNPVSSIRSWENVLTDRNAAAISEMIANTGVGRYVLKKYGTATASLA